MSPDVSDDDRRGDDTLCRSLDDGCYSEADGSF